MRRRASVGAFIAAGFVIALLLAFVVSPHASSKPDGLMKVAADRGLDRGVSNDATGNGPLANYAVSGIDDNGISKGVAGVIGVTVTFGAALGVSKLTKARRSGNVADNAAG